MTPPTRATGHDATRLAAAVRSLIDRARTADAPPVAVDEAIRLAEQAADVLAPHAHPGPYQQGGLDAVQLEAQGSELGEPGDFFPYSPIVGPANPMAPPARMHFDGERMTGTVVFGPAWAGPPGTVHGGAIALLFDEMLGATAVLSGAGGFTGTLSVRYERPTPLGAEVHMAAWLERIEGRKVLVRGRLDADGACTATAEGLFIRSETVRRGGPSPAGGPDRAL